MSRTLIALTLLASAASAVPPPEYDGGPGWLQLSPRSTFYRTSNDPGAEPAVFFILAELPFSDVSKPLTIQIFGEYVHYSGQSEAAITAPQTFCGVFTKTPTLRASNLQRRCPDALTACKGLFVSSPTYNGKLATDIPEDFRFTAKGALKYSIPIPAGAKWIALSVPDTYYGDNFDADGDLWVKFSRQ